MDDIKLFLAHAIRVERDAARRYDELMHAMRSIGNRDVEELFSRLGELSRMHLTDAMERGGFRDVPNLGPDEFQWPDGVSPEAVSWAGVDDQIDVAGALQAALAGEQSGRDYYAAMAKNSPDPEVRQMAQQFADEESEHVAELERWIARAGA